MQQKDQVFVRIQSVNFCSLYQVENNRAGLCATGAVAEQPVLAADDKGPDGILIQIVGDGYPTVQESRSMRFLSGGMLWS